MNVFERKENGTILVSIGVSWNTNPNSIYKLVTREMSTASNIRDKKTRKRVVKALDRILNTKIESNMVIYSAYDGIWTYQPEQPLVENFYECGRKFRMINQQPPHIVVDVHIDRAEVSHMIGNSVILKHVIESGIPSQHNQGGQSQQRFLRAHQEAVKSFLKRVVKETKGMSVTHIGNAILINMLGEY